MDSFFVAFASAGEAVAAARDAQPALARTPWPEDASVRTRVGLHTGSPQRHADGYVGLDVHTAARVAAAAHGGQVLVSAATAQLVQDGLASDHGLLDLGEHRLKDIPRRVRLFQLTGPDLPRDFPPARTQGSAGNLPVPMTPTVGRDDELAELQASLAGGARLVTLTGPGGSGKTRLGITLAARVATSYPDGVHFVPLEAATSSADAWAGIAQVLGVLAEGVAGPAVVEHLAEKAALLVLDNLEQVQDADEVCRELVAASPRLVVVATSRRALHVAGELEYAVAPLDLPSPTGEDVGSFSAVQMFNHVARATHREFRVTPANAAAVARLCIALDGMPLALELVAARVKLLSVDQLLERVGQSLDVAHADRSRPRRQHTIRETIDWSFQLLTPAQQVTLDYLAVFDSGADLAAVEAVLPPEVTDGSDVLDLLYDLVDASLVRVSQTDVGTRFGLLETVKQFAREHLAHTGGLAAARQAHAQHFYDRAKTLIGPRQMADPGPVDVLLADLDNMKAVVEGQASGIRDPEWYGGRTVPPSHAIALLATIAFTVSRYALALQWAREALETEQADEAGRAALHLVCCECLIRLDEPAQAIEHGSSTRPGLSAPAGQDLPRWADPYQVAVEAESWVGIACLEMHDTAGARACIERLRASARPEDKPTTHAILDLEFELAHELGDFDRAHDFLERLAANEEAMSIPPRLRALTINNLADLDLRRGRLREAQARLAESVDFAFFNPNTRWFYAATFAAVIGERHPLVCARTYGALETFEKVEGLAHTPRQREEDERVLAPIRPLVADGEWQAAWDRGRSESIDDLLREMASLPLPPE